MHILYLFSHCVSFALLIIDFIVIFTCTFDTCSIKDQSMDSCYIILYAYDILLISPSVTYTERLLHRCEQELSWLDININFNKSCCLRYIVILCVKPLPARAIVDYPGSAKCAKYT